MKIVKVTFNMPYRYGETAEKAIVDKEKLISALTDLQIQHDPEDPKEVLCTADKAVELMSLYPHSYNEVYVEKCHTVFDANNDFRDQLDAVLNRMNITAARLEAQFALDNDQYPLMRPGHSIDGPGWNQHANAPISGPVLHSFNETMLCEDYCTDALQNHLTDGWRVIAVCPQESRRPDYVLARYSQNAMARQALRG